MAHLTREELEKIGFASLGENVLISDKVSIYHADKISIGDNVRIDDFCILTGKLNIGNYAYIAVYSYLYGSNDGIIMEDFTTLAHGSRLFTDSDDYSGASMTHPMIPNEFKPKKISEPILVKKHSIVGASSLIMPGVILEEGTAIGAMSMVTKNTEPWSICAGIPAQKIKNRKKDILELEQEYLKSLDNV